MYLAALFLLLGTVKASQLRFSSDGTFKIVQLTDLHYGEDPHLDELSHKVGPPLADVIDDTQPCLSGAPAMLH